MIPLIFKNTRVYRQKSAFVEESDTLYAVAQFPDSGLFLSIFKRQPLWYTTCRKIKRIPK